MEVIDRLKIKLGIPLEDKSKDDLLDVYLLDAKDAIIVFLNLKEDAKLDSIYISSQVELARIYYLKSVQATGVKSESYSEIGVSESTTYITSAEYDDEADGVLDGLRRYRRVYVKHKEEDKA